MSRSFTLHRLRTKILWHAGSLKHCELSVQIVMVLSEILCRILLHMRGIWHETDLVLSSNIQVPKYFNHETYLEQLCHYFIVYALFWYFEIPEMVVLYISVIRIANTGSFKSAFSIEMIPYTGWGFENFLLMHIFIKWSNNGKPAF